MRCSGTRQKVRPSHTELADALEWPFLGFDPPGLRNVGFSLELLRIDPSDGLSRRDEKRRSSFAQPCTRTSSNLS